MMNAGGRRSAVSAKNHGQSDGFTTEFYKKEKGNAATRKGQ
jgi:hypothetical protein